MGRKITKIIALSLGLSLLLCSCYDRKELEEYGYVLIVGFDKGTKDAIRVTVQLGTYKNGGGGQGQGTTGDTGRGQIEGAIVSTVEAPSFFTGLNMLSAGLSRQINLMHTKYIVFSEELAREGQIETYIAPLVRYREIRSTMFVLVSKGKAEDFIMETRALAGTMPAKSMEMSMEQMSHTGFAPDTNLYDFYNDAKSGYRQPVATLVSVNEFKEDEASSPKEAEESGGQYTAGQVPREGALRREIFGAGIFNGYKMVGQLDGDDTRLLLMARGEFKRGFFSIKDPMNEKQVVPLDIRMARQPKIKVDTSGDVPKISLALELEGMILSIQSGTNFENVELKPVLEKAFADEIRNGLDELVKKSQREFGTDIMGFARKAAGNFLTIQDWQEYDFAKKYPDAKVSTEVDFVIRRTGMLQKTSEELSGSDEK